MSSYLITWKPHTENPEKGWPEDKLVELARSVKENGSVIAPWRFKTERNVTVGERIFLLRQGKRGYAILGYGRIHALHKLPDKHVSVMFETLVDPSSDLVLATTDELLEISDSKWSTQASGVAVDRDIAYALETKVVGRTPVFYK